MGGKPNRGTPKDKRKSVNNKRLTRNRPKGAGAGRTIHRKGGK
jgi:hypothetical protein